VTKRDALELLAVPVLFVLVFGTAYLLGYDLLQAMREFSAAVIRWFTP
jgi:hypothetical protein